ncbi:MAG: hypothetical protein M3Q06_07805 [Bacteroidota bacterium]|nr:hypothetical protein [Bacteroidota bacterium]
MKQLLFALLLPVFAAGQTIHYEDDKIIYKGTVELGLHSQEEIFLRLQQALPVAAKKSTDTIAIHLTDSAMTVTGEIKMKTPYQQKRKFHFLMELTPKSGGFGYKVDSVFVTEGRRGWKMKVKKAGELLAGMEEYGVAEIEAEKLLNEIDLRIQKMLRILENEMRANDADLRQTQKDAARNSVTSSQ